jgi:hypothetical protein
MHAQTKGSCHISTHSHRERERKRESPAHGGYRCVGQLDNDSLSVWVPSTDATIRQTVLTSLDARFDAALSQAAPVRALFLSLNDESLPLREQAIGILGRLAARNPACVLPSLRRALIQLLTDLEYSAVPYAPSAPPWTTRRPPWHAAGW